MIEIDRLGVAPGDLVEFHLTADGAATRHDTPPSYFQEAHLRMAAEGRAAGARQSPWVALVFDLFGEVDVRALATALLGLARRHEALHTWYDGDGHGHRHEPAGLDVTPAPATRFDDPVELREHVHRRLDAVTATGWPGLYACVVRRPDHSTVCFAVDHAYTDGHSLALVFQELRERYQAAASGGTPDETPAPGYLAVNRAERDRAAQLTAGSARLDAWAEFLAEGDGGFPPFPVDLGTGGELQAGTRREHPLFTAEEATAFRRYCARHRGGFAAGAFAALALAQWNFTGNDTYRVLTAVATRAEPALLQVHGWLVNLVPLVFRVPASRTLGDTIAVAQQAFQRARGHADVPLHRAVELLADAGPLPEIPPMVSYVDGRGAPGAGDYLTAGASLLTGPDRAAGLSLWLNWFADRADITVSMPDTVAAVEGVPHYLGLTGDLMRGALGAAEVRTG